MIAFAQSLVEIVRATESNTNCRVLELRIIEDRCVEDTASECELTPEQVRKRTYHLRRRLRELAQYFTGKSSLALRAEHSQLFDSLDMIDPPEKMLGSESQAT